MAMRKQRSTRSNSNRPKRVKRAGTKRSRDATARRGIHARYPTSGGAILVVSPQVPYRDVVQVMDEVREAGFGNSTLLGAAQ